jgi:ribosomal protein L7/L12
MLLFVVAALAVVLLVLVGALIIALSSRRNVQVVTLKPPAPPAQPSALLRQVEDADIEQHIREGYLIDAIKLYREKTGVGVKEARDAVEAWRNRMRAS